METRPLNTQQQYMGCQRQEGTATERVATTGSWTLDAHPSHYATMSTTSMMTTPSGDRHATHQREVVPNGPVVTLPLTVSDARSFLRRQRGRVTSVGDRPSDVWCPGNVFIATC